MYTKILFVVGTRPNFIKLAPLLKAINVFNKYILQNKFSPLIVHTGQHYDHLMSKILFDNLCLPDPDIFLGIGSGTHAEQTGKIMIEIEKILFEEKSDILVVTGDVNSSLAAALAAIKLHVPVAHVEAGLRSFDKSMPEEINRILIDHCSHLLFCPTQTAVDNLKSEGLTKEVFLCGDVMVDTLLMNRELSEKSDILDRLNLEKKQFVVATIHRQSNTDNTNNLKSILKALSECDEKVVFPVHPRTRKVMIDNNIVIKNKKLMLLEPLGYLDFLHLMANAKKIVTDSGGIQKEAYILKVPCITTRENTEWIETVEEKWNILVGVDSQKILHAITNFHPANEQRDIFGDGKSSNRICEIISRWILKKM